MAVEQEKRYVHVESKFQEGRLLLSIKNSKPSGTSSYQQTSKKDKIKHGRGIRSVRKVAEKYGGELLLKDQGEHFEAAGFSVTLVPIWCCWFRFIHRLCFTRHRWQGCWQYCWCPQGSFFYSAPCTARTGNWIKRNKSILAEKQG